MITFKTLGIGERADSWMPPDEQMTCAEETLLYNKLPKNEKQYAVFDDSCCIVGKH